MQLVLRDATALAGVVGVWIYVLPADGAGTWHVALSVLTGLLTTGLGYLAHEWGHLLGATAARGAFQLPASPFESFFLFRFDREHNSRTQFFAMALGGFAASVLSVVLFALLLPRDTLATHVALSLIGLGVAATLIIEVPEFWRVWRGGPIPDGAAFVSGKPGPDARG